MDSKVGIFVIVGVLLVFGTYSSMSLIFATSTDCDYNASKTKATCSVIDDDGDLTWWTCEKNPDGKTWNCTEGAQASSEDSKNAFALNDALDAAIGESQNTKKVPNGGLDNGDLLTEGGQSNNNSKVPKDLGGLNDDDENGPPINPGLQ